MTYEKEFSELLGITETISLKQVKYAQRPPSEDNCYRYDKRNNILYVYLDVLSEELKPQLSKLVRNYVGMTTDAEFYSKHTKDLLQGLYQYTQSRKKEIELIEFFNDIIPPQDLEALESAQYIKREFYKHHPIDVEKEDLVCRFGVRGRNISNLCTAGYFDSFLMPLYNDSQELFNKIYHRMVGESMMTEFVNKVTSEKQIIRNLNRKIDACRRYKLPFLHLHGIGQVNIKKIKKIVLVAKDGVYKKLIESSDGTIIAYEVIL